MTNYLSHYGVLGMKWGVRKSYKPSPKFHVDPSKTIKTNADGSKTIPVGFQFNRVGKASMDINQSGALYVSYGKDDAARYIKSLGPTLIGKLLGTAGEAVQHISVKQALKIPSDEQTTKETAQLLLSNSSLFKTFNDSIYSLAAQSNPDFNASLSVSDVKKAIDNPKGKDALKLAYGVSSFLGDENYSGESKVLYEHFRKKGYDAIPDLHDILSGTSKTSMIVINPNKVAITSTTMITKDVMKAGKNHVKTLKSLKVSDLIR